MSTLRGCGGGGQGFFPQQRSSYTENGVRLGTGTNIHVLGTSVPVQVYSVWVFSPLLLGPLHPAGGDTDKGSSVAG